MCGSYSQGTCVLPDTIIYTTKGPKLITEIENGDFVYNILVVLVGLSIRYIGRKWV